MLNVLKMSETSPILIIYYKMIFPPYRIFCLTLHWKDFTTVWPHVGHCLLIFTWNIVNTFGLWTINTEEKEATMRVEFQFYWGLNEDGSAGDSLSESPGNCYQGIKGEISIYMTLWKRVCRPTLIPQTEEGRQGWGWGVAFNLNSSM